MIKICSRELPVDIVFHPDWWHKNAGISFDESFFYDPRRRVEDERKMEQVLYERFGSLGLGEDHLKDLPQIGAVHLASGYLLSEMLGCKVEYYDDAPPQVICAHRESLDFEVEDAFQSRAFRRLVDLVDGLKAKYGYVVGDINWGGVLNLAIDVRGEEIFTDMVMEPEKAAVLNEQEGSCFEEERTEQTSAIRAAGTGDAAVAAADSGVCGDAEGDAGNGRLHAEGRRPDHSRGVCQRQDLRCGQSVR